MNELNVGCCGASCVVIDRYRVMSYRIVSCRSCQFVSFGSDATEQNLLTFRVCRTIKKRYNVEMTYGNNSAQSIP